MSAPAPQWKPLGRSSSRTAAILICLVWLAVVALAVRKLRQGDGLLVAAGGFAAAGVTWIVLARADRARVPNPIRELTRYIHSARSGGSPRGPAEIPADWAPLVHEVEALVRTARRRPRATVKSPTTAGPEVPPAGGSLTRSGLYDAPPMEPGTPASSTMSGDYSTVDMVNRLEPGSWRWIESSAAEQDFLGWTLTELRQRSFIDVVQPEDRDSVKEAFRQALVRGEALGLVVRVRTATGPIKSVEVNVGARYGTHQRATHLRCHLTDVTEQVRAERELRLRTLELTRVNEQLRRINRELNELKDRYTDLYENAPAMYFSLDPLGVLSECNQTMLSTLNQGRSEVIGHPYDHLLHEASRPGLPQSLSAGTVEEQTQWVKSDGGIIDVWVVGTAGRDANGSLTHGRFVAQDVTARRRLEAEVHEKNERLARANVELSRKNRELDEFVHVVSHDLQEPLRTLIAFSDFLARDYGERLEAEGQDYLRYLVDASRRMRAMILGMLNLSRAGRVIGEFRPVELQDLVAVVRTDLRELIRSKNAEVRIAGALPMVWGDPDRIGHLLANLITNGVKYNQSGNPWVEIGAIAPAVDGTANDVPEVAPGEAATITVRDNGIGIDPRFHETVFQLFRRLHTQEEYEGTGAGLAICNKIVQAHGGRIWVESTPGQGTTFFIRLRRPPASAPSPPASAAGRTTTHP